MGLWAISIHKNYIIVEVHACIFVTPNDSSKKYSEPVLKGNLV